LIVKTDRTVARVVQGRGSQIWGGVGHPQRPGDAPPVPRVCTSTSLSEGSFTLIRQAYSPGIAIRILGEVTPERVAIARAADHVLISEIKSAGVYDQVSLLEVHGCDLG
jgi:hypothetical protein